MEGPTLNSVFSTMDMATPFDPVLIDTLIFKSLSCDYYFQSRLDHEFEKCFYMGVNKSPDCESEGASGRLGGYISFLIFNHTLTLFTGSRIKYGIKRAKPETLLALPDFYNNRKFKRLGAIDLNVTFEDRLETLWDFAACVATFLSYFKDDLQTNQESYSKTLGS